MYRTKICIVKPIKYPHNQIEIVDECNGTLERLLLVNDIRLGKATKLPEDVSEGFFEWDKLAIANGLYKVTILGPTIWDGDIGTLLYRDGEYYLVSLIAANEIRNWWWRNLHKSMTLSDWMAVIGWVLLIVFLLWIAERTYLLEFLYLAFVK